MPLHAATGQTGGCAPQTEQQLVIYRAGSLTRAFKPLVETFTCQTGIKVKDVPAGSVDAARQITAGGQACDLYAPADDTDIDLLLKPAGYATYTITFARGKMVLVYSARALAAKKLPPLAQTSQEGRPGADDALPKAVPNWHEILKSPGVAIGAGHPFLDPGAYRVGMVFQLAEAFYHVPNLHNDLLRHVVIPGSDHAGAGFGDRYDVQLTYEHGARAMAAADPDIRCVDLPDEINLSDPAKATFYREHALVVLPGLGTPGSERAVAVPGARVAWGITVMKNAPNQAAAIRFLQLLLGPTGTKMLRQYGPTPLSPALVSAADCLRVPDAIRPLVKTAGQ